MEVEVEVEVKKFSVEEKRSGRGESKGVIGPIASSEIPRKHHEI
jgi:hypothetical protein